MKAETLIVTGALALALIVVGGAVAGRPVEQLFDLVANLMTGLIGYLGRGMVDKLKEQGQ